MKFKKLAEIVFSSLSNISHCPPSFSPFIYIIPEQKQEVPLASCEEHFSGLDY